MSNRLSTGLMACCFIAGALMSCGSDDDDDGPSGARAGEAGADAGAGLGGADATQTPVVGGGGQAGERFMAPGGAGADSGGVTADAGAGVGGAAGSETAPPTAGQAGAGGEGGSNDFDDEWPFGKTKLGARCESTEQCNDARAPGLICLAPDDTSRGAAPPSGLCTAACQTQGDCERVGAGSLCIDVLGSGDGYCVEGCLPGQVPPGETKCHARDDLACTPVYIGDTGARCFDVADCYYNELCEEGTCRVLISACLPACQGDNDCAEGLHCNRAYNGGTCVKALQSGKKLGEPCTLSDEPDECLGFCLEDVAGGTTGHCTQPCSLNYPCAFDEGSQRYQGECYYSVGLIPDSSQGDFGYCTPSCDCSAQCLDPELVCLDAKLDQSVFSGVGLCSADGTNTVEQCGAGGAGGAGD